MKNNSIMAGLVGMVLLGAGCLSSPAPTPAYIRQAAQFGEQGPQITATLQNNEPAYPAPAPVTLTLPPPASAANPNTPPVQDQGQGAPAAVTNTATGEIPPQGPNTITTTVDRSPSVATPDYLTTLSEFKQSGYYFQFYKCQATPGKLALKSGVRFMIDNRDNSIHRIGIGTKVFTLRPYQFMVTAVYAIGTTYVTCDGGGTAQILIER